MFLALAGAGIAVRLAIAWIPGDSIVTPWSGGGDMYAYVLLAHNIVSGQGYTYAHLPTAFRTPGYPLFLAATMLLFGKYFLVAARFIQALAGIAAAYFCMRAARILFGDVAGRIALVATLLLPSLAYFSGEILTESFTSFFVALFLWTLARDTKQPTWKSAIAMGAVLGLGILVRANIGVLGIVALVAAWAARGTSQRYREMICIPVVAAVIVAPWVIRNSIVFGRPLLSTETSPAILVSLVNPEARLIPDWDKELHDEMGYVVPTDLETNDSRRLLIGSELDMDRQCLEASARLWRQMSLDARFHWIAGKWVAYWLSTDQLLQPGEVSRRSRLVHMAAVVFYWIVLVLAVVEWLTLRKSRPQLALVFLLYAILITLFHTPFVMNSRIRAPLADPLLAMLAGGGAAALFKQTTPRNLEA